MEKNYTKIFNEKSRLKFMVEYTYLTSLKNKEFLVLQKLCNNSIPQIEKNKLEDELNKIRAKIKKLE